MGSIPNYKSFIIHPVFLMFVSKKQELQDVTHIAGSHEAFCALRADGSCFTWGGAKFGGDSQKVQA